MANIYDVLMGGQMDPSRAAEVARQLRRQEAIGTLGVLTGDPVMGRLGQGMIERAGSRAENVRQARQAGRTARPLGEGYYEQGGTIQRLPDYAQARERAHQRALEKTVAAAEARARIGAQEFKTREEFRRSFIPESTWSGAKGVAQGLTQIEALGSLVDPMKAAEDLSAPAADVASEFLTDIGAGGIVRMTEPMYRSLDTRQLRSSLENVLTKIRNSAFGAALTKYEGGRYEKVSPTAPGLEKDEMIRRTQNLVDYLTREANTLVAGRRTPSGEPMPTFVTQGWGWEDSSGDGEVEVESVRKPDTGSRFRLELPPGWSGEVEVP